MNWEMQCNRIQLYLWFTKQIHEIMSKHLISHKPDIGFVYSSQLLQFAKALDYSFFMERFVQ